MKKLFVLFLLLTSILTAVLSAQENRAGKIGIGYSGNLSAHSNELGMSFWVSDLITIEPLVGFQSVDIRDNSATAWRLGLGCLYRFNDFGVSPYIGARIKDNFVSGGNKTYSDLVLSLTFGGEYFVSEWFSVGAEMRLNYVKTDKEFSPVYGIPGASIYESEQVLNIRLYFR
jgi:hypothetical protein